MHIIKLEDLDKTNNSFFERIWKKIEIPHRYIVSVKNEKKKRWDLFILFLAVWNSIFAPVELSFTGVQIFENPFYNIWDYLIDLLFLGDIVIMFSTSYINRNGKEEWTPRLIAK